MIMCSIDFFCHVFLFHVIYVPCFLANKLIFFRKTRKNIKQINRTLERNKKTGYENKIN